MHSSTCCQAEMLHVFINLLLISAVWHAMKDELHNCIQLLAIIIRLLLLAPKEGRVYSSNSQCCNKSKVSHFAGSKLLVGPSISLQVIHAVIGCQCLPINTVLPRALVAWKNSGGTPVLVSISRSLTVYLPAGSLSTWLPAMQHML